MEMFGRWFRRRGWFGNNNSSSSSSSSSEAAAAVGSSRQATRFNLDGDDGGGGGGVNVATPAAAAAAAAAAAPVRTKREKWWGRSEVGVRVIVEWVFLYFSKVFNRAWDFLITYHYRHCSVENSVFYVLLIYDSLANSFFLSFSFFPHLQNCHSLGGRQGLTSTSPYP